MAATWKIISADSGETLLWYLDLELSKWRKVEYREDYTVMLLRSYCSSTTSIVAESLEKPQALKHLFPFFLHKYDSNSRSRRKNQGTPIQSWTIDISETSFRVRILGRKCTQWLSLDLDLWNILILSFGHLSYGRYWLLTIHQVLLPRISSGPSMGWSIGPYYAS